MIKSCSLSLLCAHLTFPLDSRTFSLTSGKSLNIQDPLTVVCDDFICLLIFLMVLFNKPTFVLFCIVFLMNSGIKRELEILLYSKIKRSFLIFSFLSPNYPINEY